MKKAFLAMAIVCLSFSTAAEQAYLAPLVKQSVLLDVVASEYLVIVGERGHILTSNDGEEFTQQSVPTHSTLTAVDIVGNNVWAVGHDAIILHSPDKGINWQKQYYNPDIERPFLDVLFFDEKHGIAVGAYGLFYRTMNGGESWESERHPTLLSADDQAYLEQIREEDEDFYQQELNSILPHINRVTLDGDVLYMAGEAGLLAYSNDKGKTWQRYEVDYTGSFFDIRPISDDTVVAVGLRGNIFKMENQGEWEYVSTCSTSTLNSLLPLSNDAITAMGNNGILVTIDRPLPDSSDTPYTPIYQCERPKEVSVQQLDDKAAVLNAVRFNNKIIGVSANGIKKLNLD
ncbi:WD40/YVTN/BNR-like repeat-containing protein [Alteromonas sp. ASW11-130]|uniref:WD40/YVTN/BNR-like repeat-containing protein n=1 Tax=Alteromonas sp. ASW11-130 TaxID=3015775 RepID=UPI002241BC93|nr:YCF48-related protein [Alteromonas sp. ASW11-130]MCW8092298.1 YCF48-related protein [Alteromonas sp. ASW11-130]